MRGLFGSMLLLPLLGATAVNAAAQPGGSHTATATSARRSPAAPSAVFAGHSLDEWTAESLGDTSLFRRDRAIAALRRAPPSFRTAIVHQFANALKDPSPDRRARALQALAQLSSASQGALGVFDGLSDVSPAIPQIALIARTPSDPLRLDAMWLLCTVGPMWRDIAAPLARDASRDSSAAVRAAAAAMLGSIGDPADEKVLVGLLSDRDATVRGRASYAIGLLPQRHAVDALARMLQDQSLYVRAMALKALANIGPASRSALPAIVAMINDTTHWRPGNYSETIGAEAAWAAARIVPRRGISAMPARVDIDDRGNALRSDGLGSYVASADSVDAFVSAALNLDLAGPRGDGRAARLPLVRPLRRALVFDLSHPVAGSGATARGVVRDNEAVIHVYLSHVHGKKMLSIATLDPSDSAVTSERTELQFRVNGEPYLLQMGEWTEEEFNPRAPKISGRGTSVCRIWHPAAEEWTVVAPPGSVARLWKMADPERPVDLGLYVFPFAISWSGFSPLETLGTLSPSGE